MTTDTTTWVEVCGIDDIDEEDVMRWDHGSGSYAIYRSPEGTFHATDGHCTHEKVHLADGLVLGHLIECPKHNGQFEYRTGAARRTPVCIDLRTYPVKVDGGTVFIGLGQFVAPRE